MMATPASCWLRSSCRSRAIRARSSSWALIKRPPRSWFCSYDWRSACSVRLSSSMTTASSISGVAVTRRNSCSAVAFSAGVWARNGPCPCMVPQIAWNVMINIDALIPPRPKRSAAQMSRGIGVYKRAGEVLAPAGVLSNTKIPSATIHAPTRAASSTRRGDRALGRLTNRWCAPSRNAGIRTTAVTAFEIPRLRHSIQ